jgi:hypothetical protein
MVDEQPPIEIQSITDLAQTAPIVDRKELRLMLEKDERYKNLIETLTKNPDAVKDMKLEDGVLIKQVKDGDKLFDALVVPEKL